MADNLKAAGSSWLEACAYVRTTTPCGPTGGAFPIPLPTRAFDFCLLLNVHKAQNDMVLAWELSVASLTAI